MTGTGFGTYQFAYLPYQTHADISHKRFYNADNQFIEWLVEGGWIGFSLVVSAILAIVLAVRALLKRSLVDPVGMVGLFVIVSQIFSGCLISGPTISRKHACVGNRFWGDYRACGTASFAETDREELVFGDAFFIAVNIDAGYRRCLVDLRWFGFALNRSGGGRTCDLSRIFYPNSTHLTSWKTMRCPR